MFEAGERVRLKNDPAVVGVVTDRPPEERAGRTFFQIELPTGRRSLPANQLEHVLAAPDALVPHAPRLREIVDPALPISYIGRPDSASPAEGSLSLHTVEHALLPSR